MSYTNKTASFNIAIIPDKMTSQIAIQMSEKVDKDVDSEFVLNPKNFFPHITVYQAHFPLDSIPELKRRLSLFVSSVDSFIISLCNFKTTYETFIFWLADRSNGLVNLHEKIVELANPLRRGLVLPHLKSVTSLSQEDKNDISKFGSLLIGSRYSPHITITRVRNARDNQQAMKIIGKKKIVSFKASGLILGNLGEHGTVKNVVEHFRFK